MPKQAMNSQWVKGAKGDGVSRVEFSDTNTSGLYLVIQPSGKKSWAWRGRQPQTKKSVKHTHAGGFVPYPIAVEWAQELNGLREQRKDYADERRSIAEAEGQAKAAEEALTVRTLDWFWREHYRPAHVDRLKDAAETIRMFDKLISPRVGSKALHKIKHDDLSDVIVAVQSHAPVTANRVVALLKVLFKRALSGHLRTISGLETNPAEYLTKPTVERARERVLNRAELGFVLDVLDRRAGAAKLDGERTYARGLKLIIATGCRLSEAFEAQWSHVDLEAGTWDQPAGQTKNGQPNLLKLPTATVEWLKGLKEAATGPWVFPAVRDAEKAFTGFSKSHAVIEAEVKKGLEAIGEATSDWSAHDLRRTVSTEMRGIRQPGSLLPMIPDAVVEAILNHVSGAGRQGVAAVYNRYRYFGEKAEALKIWREWLDGVAKDHEARKLAKAA